MMVELLAATLILGQQKPPNGAELVSKMFAYYSDCKTLTGTIRMTQTMMGQTTAYETYLQYEMPSKLFIRQVQRVSGKSFYVTSDGKVFSYDLPKNLRNIGLASQNERLAEPVQQGRQTLTVRDIYRAAVDSLPDRSAPLDAAIGHKEDYRFWKNQLVTIEFLGKKKLGDDDTLVFKGRWREYGDAPVSSTYNLFLTEDGHLKRYVLYDRIEVGEMGQQDVVTTWDVDLKKNSKPDPALFKVIR